MSKFGIIEMTRQKRGTKISSIVSEKCEICSGYGVIQDKKSVCYEIIEKIIKNTKNNKVSVYLNNLIYSDVREIIDKNKNNSEIKKLKIKLIEDNDQNLYKII